MNDEAGRMRRTKATILFGPYGNAGAVELASRADSSLMERLRDEREQVRELLREARDELHERPAVDHYTHQLAAYNELVSELTLDSPHEVAQRYAEGGRR